MAHVKVKLHYSKNKFEEFDVAYEEGFAFALETILDEKFKSENADIAITYFPDLPADKFEITAKDGSLIDQVWKEINKITQVYREPFPAS